MDSSQNKSGRAAPRKAKKSSDDAPLFLQKSYEMVDSAPTEIVGWSEKGDTFIVKDLEAFCDLLPKFFKHRNFRSFVRQLNFYGFRKLRADSSLEQPRPAGWWEFRHEKFLRGKPFLLPLIKRSEHYETEGGSEDLTVELKTEVSALKSRIDSMTGTIEQLTGLVEALLLERSSGIQDASIPHGCTSVAEALSKKRKVGSDQCVADVSGSALAANLARPFDNVPSMPECEQDEAKILSQLSLDEAPSGAAGEEELDRSFAAFDFSDGSIANDAALQGVMGIERQASFGEFLSKLAAELIPPEPHLSQGRRPMPLIRTQSGGIAVHA
mmetsp:Transcript_65257/g.147181  ORF Transcript_65257/g.147181 Transcript_65257/m.147181 type:complete len:326 (-) Transcript_65257:259-1236(-)